MSKQLKPIPNGELRASTSKRVREEAAKVAYKRVPPKKQKNNGEAAAAGPRLATFSKGLTHDDHGVADHKQLDTLIEQLNQHLDPPHDAETPFPGTYSSKLPAPFKVPNYGDSAKGYAWHTSLKWRSWESPLSGHAYEINGPDADQVAMPPAPVAGSAELIAEMAEVYAMACLRDTKFENWKTTASSVIGMLNCLDYFSDPDFADDPDARARSRREARRGDGSNNITPGNLFRGSSPGCMAGPYISQFLLIGNKERGGDPRKPESAPQTEQSPVTGKAADAYSRSARFATVGHHGLAKHSDGYVLYGAQTIPQQLVPHLAGRDHMTNWRHWIDVQNGANLKDGFDLFEKEPRFISTPRDLATYVHFDALYQAYLNACLILLGQGMPTDIGLPEGAGHPTRDGFALFGGPHILTLVTEVATRALKAVRRQKYNIHLRARPEAIAAAITLAWNATDGDEQHKAMGVDADKFIAMKDALHETGLLDAICAYNKKQNDKWKSDGWPVDHGWIDETKNGLLPMAFPEGSPMHPSYGAGHATVAGACVTILKAFFEMYRLPEGTKRGQVPLDDLMENAPDSFFGQELTITGKPDDNGVQVGIGIPDIYIADAADPAKLASYGGSDKHAITVQGELDKLAANISIGRDFAGVHYYTDYYESLRMGERIAVGLLQEQMLTYREPVSMRFTSFDGDLMLITGSGGSRSGSGDPDDAVVQLWRREGGSTTAGDFKAWWNRASA